MMQQRHICWSYLSQPVSKGMGWGGGIGRLACHFTSSLPALPGSLYLHLCRQTFACTHTKWSQRGGGGGGARVLERTPVNRIAISCHICRTFSCITPEVLGTQLALWLSLARRQKWQQDQQSISYPGKSVCGCNKTFCVFLKVYCRQKPKDGRRGCFAAISLI